MANQISDLSPLMESNGVGAEDYVNLVYSSLDLSNGSEDLEIIGQLRARGVTVVTD